jgi:hypothetical protein
MAQKVPFACLSLAIAAAVWALIGWREIPVGEISSSLLG